MPPETPGPIVVCLDDGDDIPSLVQCGCAYARLLDASLLLVFLMVLPSQRPPRILTEDEERRANAALDTAGQQASGYGIATTEEIWIARSRAHAIQQMAEEFQASTVIVGWSGAGPLGLFDAGRTLLRAVICPVIMVGLGRGRRARASWPPSWLMESRPGLGA